MIGLLALALLVLWACAAFAISILMAAQLKPTRWRPLIVLLVFSILLPLPVIDEIVGGFQYRALCAEHASQFRLRAIDPKGKRVRLTIDPSNKYIAGTAIPIRHTREIYRDVVSGEEIVSLDLYVASGGILMRTIGFSSPIMIGNPACSPERGVSAAGAFQLEVVN